jgi:thiamine biosynthesis lipoprotein
MSTTHEFDAIGTHWWLECLDGGVFTVALKRKIAATVKQFDQRYSRFREDSLVAELYRTGRLSHPPAEMIRMLQFARQMYDATDGAFDITVGNTLHRLGYGKRSIAKQRNTSNYWNEMIITPVEIRYPDGVMLDFGGFGKGLLIDQIVRDLKLAGVHEFIVNGGGDLYVESSKPVRFVLENPYDQASSIGHVDIMRGALAASNTIKRSWDTEAGTKHHIIDPQLGDSSTSDIVASYVRADSALIADTLATIAILRPGITDTMQQAHQAKIFLIKKAP